MIQHRTGAQKVYTFLGGFQLFTSGTSVTVGPAIVGDVNIARDAGVDAGMDMAYNITDIRHRGN